MARHLWPRVRTNVTMHSHIVWRFCNRHLEEVRMKFNKFLAAFAFGMLISWSAFAQTTASLTGRATNDGNPLPGVTVTVSSPALQGTRLAVTDVNGNYNIGALPPGEYTVRFEMESMQTVRDRKSTRLNSSHGYISYAVFCLKK